MVRSEAMKPYYDHNGITIYNGDCLNIMPDIPGGSVDMVMADPPYGITTCKWDSIIPLEPMWKQLKRVIKKNGAIVLTASQPFTTTLISSNMSMFKYCWVWEKTKAGNFCHAKNMPLKLHEDISVFSLGSVKHIGQANRMPYNPQGVISVDKKWSRPRTYESEHNYRRPSHSLDRKITQEGYPSTVLTFGSVHNPPHSTQKPVALMEYLIKTYTNEGETVLDFAMGSGTTLVAAKALGRKAIGIEISEKYCETAVGRLAQEGLCGY